MSSGRRTIQSHLGEIGVNYCTYYLTNVHNPKWPFKADLSFLSWKYHCLSDFLINSLNYSPLGQRFIIAHSALETYHEHDRNTHFCFSPRSKGRHSSASRWQNDIQCTYPSRKRVEQHKHCLNVFSQISLASSKGDKNNFGPNNSFFPFENL